MCYVWNSGSNTSATIALVDSALDFAGNDFGVDDISFKSSSSSLPVELIAFDAKYNGKSVDINWSTASEVNNDFFTVEKTKDGREYIDELSVSGAGNSTSVLSYHAVDENPLPGISFYRLKQTDYDGRQHYGNWVAVTTKDISPEIIVNKNSINSIYYACNSRGDKHADITVFDMLGKIMVVKHEADKTGTINFSALQHGVYMIRIDTNGATVVKKFIY